MLGTEDMPGTCLGHAWDTSGETCTGRKVRQMQEAKAQDWRGLGGSWDHREQREVARTSWTAPGSTELTALELVGVDLVRKEEAKGCPKFHSPNRHKLLMLLKKGTKGNHNEMLCFTYHINTHSKA